MENKKTVFYCKESSTQRIQNAAKKVTQSSNSARTFLKSAGIITPKGNLSPKYK